MPHERFGYNVGSGTPRRETARERFRDSVPVASQGALARERAEPPRGTAHTPGAGSTTSPRGDEPERLRTRRGKLCEATRMRASCRRYLIAMGLVPLGVTGACRAEPPPSASPAAAGGEPASRGTAEASGAPRSHAVATARDAGAAGEATSPASASSAPQVDIERRDAGDGAWTVERIPRSAGSGDRPAPPHASCPSGTYCVEAPSALSGPAAAGFHDCADTPPRRVAADTRFDAHATRAEREVTPTACCYSWHEPCPGGRPLRQGDALVLSSAVQRRDWSQRWPVTAEPSEPHARAWLRDHWLEQASFEHASIASFSRFCSQLLALGAPSALVHAALTAASDEIRHAQLCYGLASRYAEEPLGPGPLALPVESLDVTPTQVALETLRDGCLGESVAAELVRRGAEGALDPELSRAFHAVADDEQRHAELAWRTVAWLLRAHGAPVREVIAAFRSELEQELAAVEAESPRVTHQPEAAAGQGALSWRAQRAHRGAAVREIVLPCLDALLGLGRGPLALDQQQA